MPYNQSQLHLKWNYTSGKPRRQNEKYINTHLLRKYNAGVLVFILIKAVEASRKGLDLLPYVRSLIQVYTDGKFESDEAPTTKRSLSIACIIIIWVARNVNCRAQRNRKLSQAHSVIEAITFVGLQLVIFSFKTLESLESKTSRKFKLFIEPMKT